MIGDIECIHQSFDGSGSIYIGAEPNIRNLDILNSTFYLIKNMQ